MKSAMNIVNSQLSLREKLMLQILGYAFTALLLLPFVLFMERKEIDRSGYLPHWHRVDVYIKGDWLDGEDRVCSGIQDQPENGPSKQLSDLHCPAQPDGPFANSFDASQYSTHNLPVLFWGRISRPGISYADELSGARFSWNCTRSDYRFVCRARN